MANILGCKIAAAPSPDGEGLGLVGIRESNERRWMRRHVGVKQKEQQRVY
jgi:hypothetical protein